MAKKIKRKRAKREPSAEPSLPNRMAMEATMANLQRIMAAQEFASLDDANAFLDRMLKEGDGRLPTAGPRSPAEQAQALAYQAWEAPTEREAAALAREALAISSDCADAYNVLAEAEATSVEAAHDFYQQGLEAGARTLGEDFFEENKGHFWGMIETRPYMRARQGLADCLWAMDRRDESIRHCEALLDLNPNDHQGIRDVLLSRYLTLGNDAGAERLFRRYPEDWSAAFLWSRVLFDCRRGDRAAAKAALKRAMTYNRHVRDFFTGRAKLPTELPESYSPGDRREAALYVASFAEAWLTSPDAMEWLIGHVTN